MRLRDGRRGFFFDGRTAKVDVLKINVLGHIDPSYFWRLSGLWIVE